MTAFWEAAWTAFRRQHGPWLQRQAPAADVLYRLPAPLTAALACPLPYGRPILSPDDRAAEQDFDALCGHFQAEAVYHDQAIPYRHLRPPVPGPDPKFLQACGYSAAQIGMLGDGVAHSNELLARTRGYCGRLVTDLTFRSARDELRQAWRALPDDFRPDLPLGRPVEGLRPDAAVAAGPEVAAFWTCFEGLCDRYGLLGLPTWDLPDPAGPLLAGMPLPPHLLAGRAVVLALPAHFCVQGTDDVTGLVRRQQQAHARAEGLDPTCVGPRAAATYAHLLEIEHFGRVARSRYGQTPRPKGFVTRLHQALADHLGIGPEHFRTLHRALTGFLKGRPHAHRGAR